LGDASFHKEGDDMTSKKDFLIFTLIVIIFLLIGLIFIIIKWKNHLTQQWF